MRRLLRYLARPRCATPDLAHRTHRIFLEKGVEAVAPSEAVVRVPPETAVTAYGLPEIIVCGDCGTVDDDPR